MALAAFARFSGPMTVRLAPNSALLSKTVKVESSGLWRSTTMPFGCAFDACLPSSSSFHKSWQFRQHRAFSSNSNSGNVDKSTQGDSDESGQKLEDEGTAEVQELIKNTGITSANTGTKLYRPGTRNLPQSALRQKYVDESNETTQNVDALAAAISTEVEWKHFPDMETLDQLFDGIMFKVI